MKFIIGKKLNMTQIWGEDGKVSPATVILALPNTITQIKTSDVDGYSDLQLGYGTRKSGRVNNAQKGHYGEGKLFEGTLELRTDIGDQKVGDAISVESFVSGDVVAVSGVSKSKGFKGVVKRHGFSGGPRSHGQKHSERAPGSIGVGGVQRVFKGTRMAGRMGGDRITVRNLKVLKVFPEEGKILVSGAVPGRRGTLVEIKGT